LLCEKVNQRDGDLDKAKKEASNFLGPKMEEKEKKENSIRLVMSQLGSL